MLRAIAITGAVLVVAGIAGAAAMGAGGIEFKTLGSVSYDQTKYASGQGVRNLVVNADAAGIHISPVPGNTFEVHAVGDVIDRNPAEVQFDLVDQGDTCYITFNQASHSRWFSFGTVHRGMHLEMTVPQRIYDSLSVTTEAGAIQADNVSAAQIQLQTKAGKVGVSNVKGDVNLESNAGEIVANNVEGTVEAHTNAGAVTIHVQSIVHNIDATTNAGAIQITTARAPKDLQFEAKTDVGRASVNLPGANFDNGDQSDVVGNIGTGGPHVTLQSNVGAVSLDME